MDEPYFYIKRVDRNIETRGMPSAFFGHKIQLGDNCKPDGVFAGWAWDGNVLKIENDRYGVYPMYYYQANDEFCISPSMHNLFRNGVSAELDYTALSVFLRIGFFIGEDTPFKHIRALPPNAFIKWEDGKLKVFGKHDYAKKKEDVSYDHAMDRYNHLFQQSVEKRLPDGENFVQFLTGGRDSRRILFTLKKFGHTPQRCVTVHHFPPRPPEDVRIARLLTDRLGIKGTIFEQQKTYFDAELAKNIITNYCTDESAAGMAMFERVNGKVKMIYDGLGGGSFVYQRSSGLEDEEFFEKNQFEKLSKNIFKKWRPWGSDEYCLEMLFHAGYYEKLGIPRAIDHLSEELKKHAGAPNPIGSFLFWNRTRREIGETVFTILNKVPKIYCPYLDHEFMKFQSSLDAKLFVDRDFRADAIKRAYPEYADIPFEDKSAPCVDPTAMRVKFVRDLAAYSIKNIFRYPKEIRKRFIFPRFIRSLVDKKYSSNSWWLCPPLILYFNQIKNASHAS